MTGKVKKRFYPYRGPDLSGKKFGKLKALSFDLDERKWDCRCDCGEGVKHEANRLVSGHVKSCSSTCLWSGKVSKTVVSEMLRAYKRKHEFKISEEDFEKMIFMNCHYCGIPPCRPKKKNGIVVFLSNGIDRVDPFKGYVEGNVVPCCKICNIAKNDYTQPEFFEWIRNLVSHSCAAGAPE